jgi:hypothetical protein
MISPVKGKTAKKLLAKGKNIGHESLNIKGVSIQMISPVKGKGTILNPSWAKVSQAVCERQQN